MADNGAKEQQVTLGTHWRKPREEGYIITLPSGYAARLRPVQLDVMLATGDIPDILTPLVGKMLYEGADLDDAAELESLIESTAGMAELMGAVVRAAVIEPRIVDAPEQEDEIALEDISFEDRMVIFSLAIQPTRVLEKFCDQQGRDVEAVPDGENDGEPAE